MVQLVALALVGGLGWYAWRALQKHMAAIGDELEKPEKAKQKKSRAADAADELEKGPDGVYRLKKRDDLTDE